MTFITISILSLLHTYIGSANKKIDSHKFSQTIAVYWLCQSIYKATLKPNLLLLSYG